MGALAFIAMSCSFVIFSACVSDSEPPNTVKSFANTNVLRPLTVPQPVTFSFTPQRYTPDSMVLSRVSFDRVDSGRVPRMMPDPLDAAKMPAERGIRVGSVCPGPVDTNFFGVVRMTRAVITM